jgi:hypothetical protein
MNILVSMHENIRKIFFDSDVYNSLEALGRFHIMIPAGITSLKK